MTRLKVGAEPFNQPPSRHIWYKSFLCARCHRPVTYAAFLLPPHCCSASQGPLMPPFFHGSHSPNWVTCGSRCREAQLHSRAPHSHVAHRCELHLYNAPNAFPLALGPRFGVDVFSLSHYFSPFLFMPSYLSNSCDGFTQPFQGDQLVACICLCICVACWHRSHMYTYRHMAQGGGLRACRLDMW